MNVLFNMEEKTKNLIICSVCGLLFGTAWWIIFDIHYQQQTTYNTLLYVPMVCSTISLVLVNLIPFQVEIENDPKLAVRKIVFSVALMLGFVGVVSSCFWVITGESILSTYQKVGIPLSNIIVLAANLLFKFGVEEDQMF